MSKSKVQSLITLVLCGFQIVVLLFRAHPVPHLLTGFVSPDIVAFDEDGHDNIPRQECEKNFVTPSILGLIICSINLLKHQ